MKDILSLGELSPNISPDVYIAPGAFLIGDVHLAEQVSIWCGAVLRADSNRIQVGRGSNVQDLSVCHVDAHHALQIGCDVTVGHRCILHGCVIEDRVLVGMGAIVMNGARIGKNSIIGAGALVTENTLIPPGSLALGMPAKVVRALTADEQASILRNAQHYVANAVRFRQEAGSCTLPSCVP